MRVASLLVMHLPIKLLALAGIVGASAAAAIAIDRRRQRRLKSVEDVPHTEGFGPGVVIVDAEILGLDPAIR